jgi:predicted Zn-dependent protease with MMP-like domain
VSDERSRRRAKSRIDAALDQAWAAVEDDELDDAAEILEQLRDSDPDDPGVLDLEVELLLANDDPDGALQACERWREIDPDDPAPAVAAAEIYFEDFGDAKRAVKILRDVVARGGLEIDEEADARWLLGAALDERRDHKGAAREWLAVLRLDAAAEPDAPRMSHKRFEKVAERALGELPDEILEWLANVPVLVDDRPSEAMVLDGIDPRILGLFTGVPVPDQSVLGGAPPTGVIHLFQRNLERETRDEEELADEIRVTVLHETAHYFGYDEDDLERLGLD